jgi:putative aminopeptidase FrvX
MRNSLFARLMSSMIIVALLNLGFVQSAVAAGIDTATVVRSEERTEALTRIHAQLGRADVRVAMIGLGVDPAHATTRVAALTDTEVALLDRELDQLPAGGDGGWILLVIVLGILVWLFATGKLKLN